MSLNRRALLRNVSGALASAATSRAWPQDPGQRPDQSASLKILNPRNRVPVSFIIDDSTCLVNLNRFGIPQFAAAMGRQNYSHDWRSMPHEIPDDFVRKFGDWCGEHGVRGKYSIVPYPACVGRLDRELPGWTAQELKASIDLVRSFMTRDWDIHPEMVTHTRIIDTRTGHPIPRRGPEFMENWDWTKDRSADEITDYMIYALQILKNIDLPCEGVTTPGGFGHQVPVALAQATLRSCREVYSAEIPHYFRWAYSSGERSVVPRVEFASDLDTDDPKCVVSIIGCTRDWTGGWDCSETPEPDRYITADLTSGRLVDVIDRGEPACLVSHWTGIHFHGEELGFKAFQEVVRRLHRKYDNLIWMKNSELARYWAARELTAVEASGDRIRLRAPYACPGFTLEVPTSRNRPPSFLTSGTKSPLREVSGSLKLEPATWTRNGESTTLCFDLPKGDSEILL